MGENPIHRKTKVSRGRLVRPGLVGLDAENDKIDKEQAAEKN